MQAALAPTGNPSAAPENDTRIVSLLTLMGKKEPPEVAIPVFIPYPKIYNTCMNKTISNYLLEPDKKIDDNALFCKEQRSSPEYSKQDSVDNLLISPAPVKFSNSRLYNITGDKY